MNLVQINERLKDLPMQVLQQYANGMNPEVPPYLALGELQRREMSQKQAATAQGGQQGPQPSVKEQVEQKAGLMQLQQMQQQQMAQQMQQPRGPMPVPPGAPQPEAQPEVAMASGGLAAVPMRPEMFEYARGGIIAFQAGGDTMGTPSLEQQELTSQAAAITDEMVAERRNKAKMIAELEQKLAFLTNAGAPQAAEVRAQLAALKGPEAPKIAPSAPPAARQAPPPQAGAKPDSGLLAAARAKPAPVGNVQPAVGPAAPRPAAPAAAGLPAALSQAPVQTGAPAAASIPVSPDREEVDALMKAQTRAAPTAQGVISDVNALMPAGMQEGAQQKLLADQRARAEARQAAYDKSQPDGLDNLIRVLGQAGQYKGFSGIGPAYTAMQQQRRAEDLAMQKQQDELMTAIEGRGTAFDKDVFTARTGAMDKAQTLFGQSQKSILEAAAKKLEASQGRLDKESQLNMQRDLKMFEIAQEERLKSMDIDQRNRDIEQRERESKRNDARSPAAQAAQYVAIMQRSRNLRENGKPEEADKLAAQAADMLAFKGGGGGGNATVGAENAQTRKLRDAVKDIDSRLETMDPRSPEIKTLQAQRDRLSKMIVDRAMGEAGAGSGAPSGEVDKKNPLLQ
jgi:hypothetical protein